MDVGYREGTLFKGIVILITIVLVAVTVVVVVLVVIVVVVVVVIVVVVIVSRRPASLSPLPSVSQQQNHRQRLHWRGKHNNPPPPPTPESTKHLHLRDGRRVHINGSLLFSHFSHSLYTFPDSLLRSYLLHATLLTFYRLERGNKGKSLQISSTVCHSGTTHPHVRGTAYSTSSASHSIATRSFVCSVVGVVGGCCAALCIVVRWLSSSSDSTCNNGSVILWVPNPLWASSSLLYICIHINFKISVIK